MNIGILVIAGLGVLAVACISVMASWFFKGASASDLPCEDEYPTEEQIEAAWREEDSRGAAMICADAVAFGYAQECVALLSDYLMRTGAIALGLTMQGVTLTDAAGNPAKEWILSALTVLPSGKRETMPLWYSGAVAIFSDVTIPDILAIEAACGLEGGLV